MQIDRLNSGNRHDRISKISDVKAATQPKHLPNSSSAPSQGSGSSTLTVVILSVFDFTLTTVALLLLLPVFMVLALVVRLDSPGSVLFKQKRVGLLGREFWFYKFRSMIVDAEKLRASLSASNEATGPLFKMKNDPRITRAGRVLRKYSLDELPQLLNVLKLDMSLVGPRPALPAEVAQYNTRQLRRLDIKPGITGLWQISGRSDLSFEQAVELDISYVERRSISLYVIILLKTIPAVILGRGAY